MSIRRLCWLDRLDLNYMELKQYLKANFGWNEYKIISDNELISIYNKANFTNPPAKMVKFVSFFYNLNFKFKETDINFNIKNILLRNSYDLYFDQYCEVVGVSNITPFAEIEDGYTVLVSDDKNNIYGICDDLKTDLGNDYYRMLEKVASNTYYR